MHVVEPTYTPQRCVFETTLACNLNCRHCGSRAGRARPDELSTAEALDLFDQLAGLGCRRVTLSGGEPLVRGDWPELIAGATRAGLAVALITNGLGFDAATARLAKRSGLRTVGVSIDGIGRTHDRVRGRIGLYDVCVAALEAARAAGLSFTIITHVNRLNLPELGALYELARDRGAFSWQVQTGIPMGNMRENPDLVVRPRELVALQGALARLIRRREQRIAVCNSIGYFGPDERALRRAGFQGCAAGKRTLGIESNGNVRGCLSLLPNCDADGAAYVEGNVRETPLAEIWNRPGAFAYTRDWSPADLGEFCRACDHLDRCRGGCTASRAAAGDLRENRACILRLLEEEERGDRRGGAVATAAFAALLGVSLAGCRDTDRPDDDSDDDASSDTDADTDGDGDADSDTDAYDSDTDVDYYDVDVDSDTDAYDTDTDVDYYDVDGDGDTDLYDADSDMDGDTDVDTDTHADADSGVDASPDGGSDAG